MLKSLVEQLGKGEIHFFTRSKEGNYGYLKSVYIDFEFYPNKTFTEDFCEAVRKWACISKKKGNKAKYQFEDSLVVCNIIRDSITREIINHFPILISDWTTLGIEDGC